MFKTYITNLILYTAFIGLLFFACAGSFIFLLPQYVWLPVILIILSIISYFVAKETYKETETKYNNAKKSY